MATYNGGKYIRQQLESVLAQIGAEDEVVVSDDGSTDDTLQIVNSFEDKRIKIFDGPKAHSASLNFENAMRHSSGEYIFLCDQDDVWLPNKVSVMLAALQVYDCVVSDCYITDGDLNVISNSFRNSMHFKNGRLYNLLARNSYSGSCMAFRRRVMLKSLPMPNGVLMHDIWLGNVAAYKFSLTFLPDRLIYFRRHEATTSSAGHKSRNSMWTKISSRFITAYKLIML